MLAWNKQRFWETKLDFCWPTRSQRISTKAVQLLQRGVYKLWDHRPKRLWKICSNVWRWKWEINMFSMNGQLCMPVGCWTDFINTQRSNQQLINSYGRPYRGRVTSFGSLCYGLDGTISSSKHHPSWLAGMWLGKDISDHHILAVGDEKLIRCRAVRQTDKMWDKERLVGLTIGPPDLLKIAKHSKFKRSSCSPLFPHLLYQSEMKVMEQQMKQPQIRLLLQQFRVMKVVRRKRIKRHWKVI